MFDQSGCGGLLLELGKEICVSLPANRIYSTCQCGPKILEAKVTDDMKVYSEYQNENDVSFQQQGTITDGDGSYIPGVDDCSWLIAPPDAKQLQLTLSKFEFGGDGGEDNDMLEIVICKDRGCTEFQHIPGSPFDKRSDAFLSDDCTFGIDFVRKNPSGFTQFPPQNAKVLCVTTMDPINASIVRIRFSSSTSIHSTARFVIHYKTVPESPLDCLGVKGHLRDEPRMWHHASAAVTGINCTHIRACIYVNGSLKTTLETEMISSNSQCPALSLMLTGDSGIAIGRADTTKPPPVLGRFQLIYMDTSRSKPGADSFWAGDLDELKIWNSSKNGVELYFQVNTSCSANSSNSYSSKPLACFGFEGFNSLDVDMNFEDYGFRPPCKAVPMVGDKESSWCNTRGDDGMRVDFQSTSNPTNQHLGASWGICTDRPRLPGLGFEYSESDLLRLEDAVGFGTPAFNALNLPGCAQTAINFTSNRAIRYH